MLILLITVANTILTTIFLKYKIVIILINNIYIIFSNFLWLLLLKNIVHLSKMYYFIIGFLIFSIFNLFFYEKPFHLNTKTFIYSALIYVIIYIYICIKRLNEERLDYFTNNNFILISSPILFFVGYSIMFGFKSRLLDDVILFKIIKLFDFISYFSNYIFYTLIIIYIYRERNIKNE